MAKAKMSIGSVVSTIPPQTRRKDQKTRITTVRKALAKIPEGAVIPVYTGSVSSAYSLAQLLRKTPDLPIAKTAARKHIVYVQKATTTTTQNQETTAPEMATTL